MYRLLRRIYCVSIIDSSSIRQIITSWQTIVRQYLYLIVHHNHNITRYYIIAHFSTTINMANRKSPSFSVQRDAKEERCATAGFRRIRAYTMKFASTTQTRLQTKTLSLWTFLTISEIGTHAMRQMFGIVMHAQDCFFGG